MSEVKFFGETHLVALTNVSGKSLSNIVKRNGVNVYFFEGTIDTSRGDGLDSMRITQRFNSGGYIGWGDGTVEEITTNELTTTHNYASGGVYTIRISKQVAWNASTAATGAQKWTDLVRLDSFRPNSAGNGAFSGAGFTTWTLLRGQQKGQGTGINNYFSSNSGFVSGLLNGMDIDGTPISCTSLVQSCTIYNEDLGTWNLKPTGLSNAFSGANAFNHDLSNWDVSTCGQFNGTFKSQSFNNGGVNMGAWDMSSAGSMEEMFSSANAFNDGGTPGVSNGGVGVGMDSWDVRNVVGVRRMFLSNSAFNTYIGSWQLHKVNDMYAMFFGASAFNQDLSNWTFNRTRSRGANTSTVANKLVDSGANFIADGVENNYRVLNLTDKSQPQATVTAVTATELTLSADIFTSTSERYVVWSSGFGLQLVWSGSNFNSGLASGVAGTRMGNWDITGCGNLQNVFQSNNDFNQDITTWNIATVTYMAGAFQSTVWNYDLSNWERTTLGDESSMCRVTNIGGMFQSAQFNAGLASGVAGTRLSNWDLRNNESLQFTFFQNSWFNQNIGAWNTVKVTTMRACFQLATSFNCGAASGVSSTNISGWNTSLVDTFQDCFRQANSFNNDISTWDVSGASSLNSMFHTNTAFNQNLGTWKFQTGAIASSLLYGASAFTDANVAACLTGWDAVVGQGDNVQMASWCASTSGPRSLAIATYPAAKTAYDNLIAPTPGGRGWDMTGAITWV